MSKNANLLAKVKKNGGSMVDGEEYYTHQQCHKCDQEFILEGNDNPMFDDARVIEFPDTCNDCL